MERIEQDIRLMLGENIISLDMQDVMGIIYVSLTYSNKLPVKDVKSRIQSRHPQVVFDDITRVYTEDVIQRVYAHLYGQGDYDDYWEVSEVGKAIDEWLGDREVKAVWREIAYTQSA